MVAPDKQERAILEAIRRGSAPPVVKRRASRGTIPVPLEEMLEILVFLAHDADPTCRDEAKRTLADWSEDKIASLLVDPKASAEVLAFFSQQAELSSAILAAIVSHPRADDATLEQLAARLPVEQIQQVVASNAHLERLSHFIQAVLNREDLPGELREHLQPIAFRAPLEGSHPAAASVPEETHEASSPEEKRLRISISQKIARMTVAERIHLALSGTKEERYILVRDPVKEVYRAVVRSPRLSDTEVEAFAAMNNVAEEVLRIIAADRRYIKNYIVVRNLVSNPRTPIDISVGFLNRLTENDLKHLSRNRNVSDTVRSLATRLHKQRSDTRAAAKQH